MTWTVHNVDCLEFLRTLPDGSVDAVVTDPVWPNCPPGLLLGSDDPDGLFASFCGLLPRIRQLVVVMRNDSDPRMLRHIPDNLPFQQVCWLQYVMPGYLGRVLGGNECAYVYGRPISSLPGQRVIPSVAPKAQPGDRKCHPCPRSDSHTSWLIRWFTEPGETVLDPFCGIGTTGAAAISQGRNFIGCELDPGYAEIARRRCREAEESVAMFASVERTPSAPAPALFGEPSQ